MDIAQLADDLWCDARLFAMSSEDRMEPSKNVERLKRRLQVAIDAAVKQTVEDQQRAIAEASEESLYRKRKDLMEKVAKLTQELGELERKKKAVQLREKQIKLVEKLRPATKIKSSNNRNLQDELDRLEAQSK